MMPPASWMRPLTSSAPPMVDYLIWFWFWCWFRFWIGFTLRIGLDGKWLGMGG